MKLIGIMMILVSCTLCGATAASKQLRKVKRLQSIELMLTQIGTEIRFCRKTLFAIFEGMKEEPEYANLNFLRAIKASDCDSFEKLWRESIQGDTTLTNDELLALMPLGASLGSTDIDGQNSALNLAIEKISSMLDAERSTAPEKARFYMSMGVLGGAALAVLMI